MLLPLPAVLLVLAHTRPMVEKWLILPLDFRNTRQKKSLFCNSLFSLEPSHKNSYPYIVLH